MTESNTTCIELCALDKGRRLIGVARDGWITYVPIPFDRKGEMHERYAAAKALVDARHGPVPAWHLLTPHRDKSPPPGLTCWTGELVPRAMRVGLTAKQNRDRAAFNVVWCPAVSEKVGWAWINEGDPGTWGHRGNEGLILHVQTGMRIWAGKQKFGLEILKRLRKACPNVFAETPFGTTPPDSDEVRRVKAALGVA